MKYHFIGICGAGMSVVAKILKDKGHTITGSDIRFFPPISDFVKKEGWDCKDYDEKNITDDIDVVVISGSAGVKVENNPELKLAIEKKIPIRSFAEILSEVSAEKQNIVCVGSYGKSTTTAITAWCLENAGKNPSYFIGAMPKTPNVSGKFADGEYFVLEGDEYKTSNLDLRSKFMHYHPDHVILTSLAHDHMNIYPTHDEYLQNFFDLFAITKKSLTVCITQKDVANNFEKIKEIANKNNTKIITYGMTDSATYHAKNINFDEITTFDIYKNNDKLGEMKMRVIGRHNIENFVGAFAMLYENNILTFVEIADGVSKFVEIDRRLNIINKNPKIKIYEGFGSSYEKCKSAIEAIRDHFPDNRLQIIFEPHTFSWREKSYIGYYKDLFDGADIVYMCDPKKDTPDNDKNLLFSDILKEVQKHHRAEKLEDIQSVAKDAKDGDIFLILTSGSIDGRMPEIVREIDKI